MVFRSPSFRSRCLHPTLSETGSSDAAALIGYAVAVQVVRQLPAHPAAVAAARRLVRATCAREHLETIRAEAVLLTSELVSAAVTQARAATPEALLRLWIEAGAGELEVAVSVPESCTGLHDDYARALVDTLAREWGIEPQLRDLGRALWFRVGNKRDP